MSRRRAMALAEALTEVVVGYALTVATQFSVVPLIGVEIRMRRVLLTGLAVALVSRVRGYLLRRLFDGLQTGA